MSDDELIKKMSDLLKSGATMLGDHCPECGSPLFKIQEDIWCSKCNKRVIKVKEGDVQRTTITPQLNDVEKATLVKIREISKQISEETNIVSLEKLSDLLLKLFEVLEKTKRFQKM